MLGITISGRLRYVARHPVSFFWRAFKAYMHNGGVLLSSAVAYNTLLSLIPTLALSVLALSHWFDVETVENVLRYFLELVAPMQIDLILKQLHAFYAQAGVISVIGGVSLVFFSSFAFSTLETALTIIFGKKGWGQGRKAWISLLLPYAFLLMFGFVMLIMTLVISISQAPAAHGLGHWISDSQTVSEIFGFVGEVVLFTVIYYVLPPVAVSLKHALVGAVTAAVLWELMRRLIVWYFVNLSFVNIIYGTFATVLIVILSLEVAVTILLFGAQVIKEYSDLDLHTSH
ncbi:MAG: YihY/virulence factor BrkB family protein [Acidiferrobacterales bacterium]